jgi:hypothetical protein
MLIFIFATVLPRACLLKAVIPLTYAADLLVEGVFRTVTEFAQLFALERFLVVDLDADLDADFDAELDADFDADFDADLFALALLLRVVLSPQVPFAMQELPAPILYSCQHFL